MFDGLLALLYPPRCPACRRLMESDGTLIHEECRSLMKRIMAPRCLKCGRHIEDEETALCSACVGKRHAYDYGFAAIEYNSCAKQAMVDFKFNCWKDNSAYFIREAVEAYGEELKMYAPEILVPVPVSKRRLRERGFNQAQLLAEGLGEALNIPVRSDLLRKESGSNVQQKKLSARDRRINAGSSFFCENQISYKKICIIDDIYTTGSTMDSCARALKKAGAAEVGFAVICTGRTY